MATISLDKLYHFRSGRHYLPRFYSASLQTNSLTRSPQTRFRAHNLQLHTSISHDIDTEKLYPTITHNPDFGANPKILAQKPKTKTAGANLYQHQQAVSIPKV